MSGPQFASLLIDWGIGLVLCVALVGLVMGCCWPVRDPLDVDLTGDGGE